MGVIAPDGFLGDALVTPPSARIASRFWKWQNGRVAGLLLSPHVLVGASRTLDIYYTIW